MLDASALLAHTSFIHCTNTFMSTIRNELHESPRPASPASTNKFARYHFNSDSLNLLLRHASETRKSYFIRTAASVRLCMELQQDRDDNDDGHYCLALLYLLFSMQYFISK